ncbi:pentatricopeptide repeat-containing protein [Tanacetum coccineum]|uniref:Pentatricopeptide repeat-containing protein n=1 Tax=Tanacetum coccineum TaxID=301880 RepID=A0ABQ5GZP0_9ASTR
MKYNNEKIKKVTSYTKEITAFMEKFKIKKLTGVKSKELLMWIPVSEISVDTPPTGKITFRTRSRFYKSFLVSVFQIEDVKKEAIGQILLGGNEGHSNMDWFKWDTILSPLDQGLSLFLYHNLVVILSTLRSLAKYNLLGINLVIFRQLVTFGPACSYFLDLESLNRTSFLKFFNYNTSSLQEGHTASE